MPRIAKLNLRARAAAGKMERVACWIHWTISFRKTERTNNLISEMRMQEGELRPPLKQLHADDSLKDLKLKQFDEMLDAQLLESLLPGQEGSLKVRPDGTILDGNHRIKILRKRGIDVDSVPREIIRKDSLTEESH